MTTRTASGWGTCPKGEWQHLSSQLLWKKWILFARNTAIATVAALGLAGGTWAAASQIRSEPHAPQGTPCHTEPPCGMEWNGCKIEVDGAKKE